MNFLAIITVLNIEVSESLGVGIEDCEYSFFYSTNGWQHEISLNGSTLWTSEEDDRRFLDDLDDYEPLIDLLRREFAVRVQSLSSTVEKLGWGAKWYEEEPEKPVGPPVWETELQLAARVLPLEIYTRYVENISKLKGKKFLASLESEQFADRKLKKSIRRAFIWSDSLQGHEYWRDIAKTYGKERSKIITR